MVHLLFGFENLIATFEERETQEKQKERP